MFNFFQQPPNEKVANGGILRHWGLERHKCLYIILYNMYQPIIIDRGDFLVVSPFATATPNAKACCVQSITKGATAGDKASTG